MPDLTVLAVVPYGLPVRLAADVVSALADRFPNADVRAGQTGLEILVEETPDA